MRKELLLVIIGSLVGIAAAALSSPHAAPVKVSRACTCGPLADPGDLPLVVRRAPRPGRTMAVLITGDGGWRAIDKNIAAGLNARGVSVVGLVSPSFFRKGKTPAEAACALRRIIEYYTIAWHAPDVIVSGYSRGAGVAPFMVARLPLRWRAHVRSVVFIALEPTIHFAVAPLDLLRTAPAPSEIPVAGEIERLRGTRMLCIYGVADNDSVCRQLSPSLVTPVPEPGGHHFAGSYDQLAGTILGASRG